jgi:hypothetical protein
VQSVELEQLVQQAIQEPQGLLETLEQQVQLALREALAKLDLLEAKVIQEPLASLERQDPRVLLAQQVLLEAQGLLDPQGQLE